MLYILVLFTVFLLISLYFNYNLLKKVEVYEDKIAEYEEIVLNQQEYIERISNIVAESRDLIKQLDEKGIFEADDEVGTFFRFLKDIQDILSNFIITEKNGKSKE